MSYTEEPRNADQIPARATGNPDNNFWFSEHSGIVSFWFPEHIFLGLEHRRQSDSLCFILLLPQEVSHVLRGLQWLETYESLHLHLS